MSRANVSLSSGRQVNGVNSDLSSVSTSFAHPLGLVGCVSSALGVGGGGGTISFYDREKSTPRDTAGIPRRSTALNYAISCCRRRAKPPLGNLLRPHAKFLIVGHYLKTAMLRNWVLKKKRSAIPRKKLLGVGELL